MSQFYTGEELSNKLTDIIWNAKTELLILSPFIHLDDYCKKVFKNYKHTPELEVVLVFGKNEREAGRSLNKTDLDFFKEFKNITIIGSVASVRIKYKNLSNLKVRPLIYKMI